MKKLFIITCMLFLTISAKSQETAATFEGEIAYETFETYSDYLLEMPHSIYFNGVHKIRMVVKGSKIHITDETTGCHIVGDSNSKQFVHFCDHTKSGLDYSADYESQLVLASRDITYSNFTSKLNSNTISHTNDTTEILGHKCAVYQGAMERDMSMIQKYEVKAHVATDIPISDGYKYGLQGLELPGMPLKWTYKYDGGHVGMGVGELSFYIESDITDIKPRQVDDSEFNIPAEYKIKTYNGRNPMGLMNYYKSIKKGLIKQGIKGGDNSEKSTGVHYKTNDEWDF